MCLSSRQSIIAEGKELDLLATSYGFKRRRYFWIFKESDRKLRERMVAFIKWQTAVTAQLEEWAAEDDRSQECSDSERKKKKIKRRRPR
jgi:hypothetical protein